MMISLQKAKAAEEKMSMARLDTVNQYERVQSFLMELDCLQRKKPQA